MRVPSPLGIYTDEAPAIMALRSQILKQKMIMADPSDPGYPGQAAALSALQSQLDDLLNARGPGSNVTAPPPAAPVFSGPRIDDPNNVGVAALKLISYPGVK